MFDIFLHNAVKIMWPYNAYNVEKHGGCVVRATVLWCRRLRAQTQDRPAGNWKTVSTQQ